MVARHRKRSGGPQPVKRQPEKLILYCCDCLFWSEEPEKKHYGECRRKAPEMEIDSRGKWPETYKTEYCGEFAPREKLCSEIAFCHHTPADCAECEHREPAEFEDKQK